MDRVPKIFFGIGAGRCGTMAIANALANEPGVICTHEGLIRNREDRGETLLRYLTLENRLAYEMPEQADEIFRRTRGDLLDIALRSGASHFGDIAYNYSPFVRSISSQFPESKFLLFFRNGIDFVRTATRLNGEDHTPVGWPPNGKPLSPVEQYVSLGRLAPRARDPLSERWASMDHLARNAWLWAETNRLILEARSGVPPSRVFELKYEDFFKHAPASYCRLRAFLGLPGDTPDSVRHVLERRINSRPDKAMGEFSSWSESEKSSFTEFAGPMMVRLGYGAMIEVVRLAETNDGS